MTVSTASGVVRRRSLVLAIAFVVAGLGAACVKVTPEGNEAFLTMLARDLRGSQASSWTRDDELARLAEGTSRLTLARDAGGSQEADDRRIHEAFDTILGHPPTADDESRWLVDFGNGRRELDLLAELLASDELYAQAGGNDPGLVDRLATIALGQPFAPAVRDDLLARLTAGESRDSVSRAVWTSPEAARRRVTVIHQRLLGRTPTDEELTRWTATLTTQDDVELEAALAGSDGYYRRATTRLASLDVDTALLRVGAAGVPWSSPLVARGGTPPYEWAVADAPVWLTIDGSALSGTPTAAANQTIVLTVRDATGTTATRRVPLRISAAEPPARAVWDPGAQGVDWQGLLTPDGEDRYDVTFGGGRLVVSAPDTNVGGNLRAVVLPSEAPEVSDGLSCATWTTRSEGGYTQQGAALRVRVSDDGRIRALTVTKNVVFGATWLYNLHTWDTDRSQVFVRFGVVDLTRVFRRPTMPTELPRHLCARVRDGELELKAWLLDEPEPAWGDPLHGGRAPIPDGWEAPGRSGWFLGHLPPGGSATFDGLISATYDPAPASALGAAVARGATDGADIPAIHVDPGPPPS